MKLQLPALLLTGLIVQPIFADENWTVSIRQDGTMSAVSKEGAVSGSDPRVAQVMNHVADKSGLTGFSGHSYRELISSTDKVFLSVNSIPQKAWTRIEDKFFSKGWVYYNIILSTKDNSEHCILSYSPSNWLKVGPPPTHAQKEIKIKSVTTFVSNLEYKSGKTKHSIGYDLHLQNPVITMRNGEKFDSQKAEMQFRKSRGQISGKNYSKALGEDGYWLSCSEPRRPDTVNSVDRLAQILEDTGMSKYIALDNRKPQTPISTAASQPAADAPAGNAVN